MTGVGRRRNGGFRTTGGGSGHSPGPRRTAYVDRTSPLRRSVPPSVADVRSCSNASSAYAFEPRRQGSLAVLLLGSRPAPPGVLEPKTDPDEARRGVPRRHFGGVHPVEHLWRKRDALQATVRRGSERSSSGCKRVCTTSEEVDIATQEDLTVPASGRRFIRARDQTTALDGVCKLIAAAVRVGFNVS